MQIVFTLVYDIKPQPYGQLIHRLWCTDHVSRIWGLRNIRESFMINGVTGSALQKNNVLILNMHISKLPVCHGDRKEHYHKFTHLHQLTGS